MAELGYYFALLNHGIAYCADLIAGVAFFGAACCLCILNYCLVVESIDIVILVAVATGTAGVGGVALIDAGRRGYNCFVAVAELGYYFALLNYGIAYCADCITRVAIFCAACNLCAYKICGVMCAGRSFNKLNMYIVPCLSIFIVTLGIRPCVIARRCIDYCIFIVFVQAEIILRCIAKECNTLNK